MAMNRKTKSYLASAIVSALFLPGVVLLGKFLDFINLTFFDQSWPQSVVIPGFIIIIEFCAFLGAVMLVIGTPIFLFLFLRELRRASNAGKSMTSPVVIEGEEGIDTSGCA